MEDIIERLRSIEMFDKYVNFLSKKSNFEKFNKSKIQVYYPNYCWTLMNLYCVLNADKSSINKKALLIYKDELNSIYNSLNNHKEKKVDLRKQTKENALRLKYEQIIKDRFSQSKPDLNKIKIDLSVVNFLLEENFLTIGNLQLKPVEYCDFAR